MSGSLDPRYAGMTLLGMYERADGAASAAEDPPGDGVELLHQGRVAQSRLGHDRVIERAVRADRAGLVLGGKIAQEPADQSGGAGGAGLHDIDHRGDVDRAMLLVPAIVIGDYGDRGVGNLGLAG